MNTNKSRFFMTLLGRVVVSEHGNMRILTPITVSLSLTLDVHTRPTTTLRKIYKSIQGPKGDGYVTFPL
jgi:hypothetical protein